MWFIPSFMQVAWPLHELNSGEDAGKKKVAITWDDRFEWCFDDLKHRCTMAPFLAYADFTRLLNSIPMLVDLAWGLSSTRLMMTVTMLSLPTPVGAWQRPNPTALPTNWGFLPLSGLWSWIPLWINPLTSIQTAKLDAASHWWVASLANYSFSYSIGMGKLMLTWMPCQGYPSQGACPMPQPLTSRSLQQPCKLCRRPHSKAQQVPSKHVVAICILWTLLRTVCWSPVWP